jgi:Lon protease-like protein
VIKAGNASYSGVRDFPETIPVFPLTGALLLPGGHMPLNIFEPRYLQMITDAMQDHKLVGMIQPDLKNKNTSSDVPPLSQVGCIGRITACQETGDGRILISLGGVCRFKILEEPKVSKLYRKVRYEIFEDDLDDKPNQEGIDRHAVITAFRNYLESNGMDADWDTVNETETDTLITALCMMSPFEPAEKQALLEAPTLKMRAETLVTISDFYLARNLDAEVATVQ